MHVGQPITAKFSLRRLYEDDPVGHGGISVSIPEWTSENEVSIDSNNNNYSSYSSKQGRVEATYSGETAVIFRPRGGPQIFDSSSTQIDANYLLVESDDTNWPEEEINTLTLTITPLEAGEFTIYYRYWLCGDVYQDCTRSTLEGITDGITEGTTNQQEKWDQQGYRVYNQTITVKAPEVGGSAVKPPANITLGESFDLSFSVNRRDGPADGRGGVSVSFPDLTDPNALRDDTAYSSDQGGVTAAYTGGSDVVIRPVGGRGIFNSAGIEFSPRYLLVESDDSNWSTARQNRTLTLSVKPKETGAFRVYYRYWMCDRNYGNCDRIPDASPSSYDQQGWRVATYTVNVLAPPAPEVGGSAVKPPANITLGESFDLSFSVNRRDGPADGRGGVSVSFPDLTDPNALRDDTAYSSDQGGVTAAYTGETDVVIRPLGGRGIFNSAGIEFNPSYLLVESDDSDWITAGQNRTLTLSVKPKKTGAFRVYYRYWMCDRNYGNCDRIPDASPSSYDQQGWRVATYTVNVLAPSPGQRRQLLSHGKVESMVDAAVGVPLDLEFSIGQISGSSTARGGITIAFPDLTSRNKIEIDPETNNYSWYSSDEGDVKATYSGSSDVIFRPRQGPSIFNSHSQEISPSYLLIESDDTNWITGEYRNLTLTFIPTVPGEFRIYYRYWLCDSSYDNCDREPTAASVGDQQGWAVWVVTVAAQQSGPRVLCDTLPANPTAGEQFELRFRVSGYHGNYPLYVKYRQSNYFWIF